MVLILKLMGIIFLLIVLVLAYYWLQGPFYIMKYIMKNPLNGSVYLMKNNEIILNKNSDTLMPLASVVKVIIAIEFVRQIVSEQLNKDELIDISEINKYYTDKFIGGAHKYWLGYIQENNKLKGNEISLYEIAKGMIEFSSNANTEYLMHRLGIDNINKSLIHLDLKQHEKIFPFISLASVIHKHTLKQLKNMTKEQYVQLSHEMHDILGNSKGNNNIPQKEFPKEKMQFFSDFLIRGTTQEYVSVLKKLNDRDYFLEKEYEYLDALMEPSIPSKNMVHEGFKGGSTSSVLTSISYGTSKNGIKIEMAVFLNNLTYFQYLFYSMALFKFQLDVWDEQKLKRYQNLLYA